MQVQQVGSLTLNSSTGESFTITNLPNLSVSGILSGVLFIELSGKTTIESSCGSIAEIEFIPKGLGSLI